MTRNENNAIDSVKVGLEGLILETPIKVCSCNQTIDMKVCSGPFLLDPTRSGSQEAAQIADDLINELKNCKYADGEPLYRKTIVENLNRDGVYRCFHRNPDHEECRS